MKRNLLHSVPTSSNDPVDITLALRARIMERDWSAVMIWGDKQTPVDLPDGRRKGRWT